MFAPVLLSLLSAAPSPPPEAPFLAHPPPSVRLVQSSPDGGGEGRRWDRWPRTADEVSLRVTLKDAPVTPLTAFGASVLTSLTGFASLIGLLAVSPETATHPRLAASLLLLSVGPSVGDLLAHDAKGFLLGAGGRTALAAASYGVVMAIATASGDSAVLLIVPGILFVTMAAIVWTGWGAADLVRSYFAPQRWVTRQNALRPHPPAAAVPGQPGVFRM